MEEEKKRVAGNLTYKCCECKRIFPRAHSTQGPHTRDAFRESASPGSLPALCVLFGGLS